MRQLLAVEQVRGRPGAVKDDEIAEFAPAPQYFVDYRADRREPDSAGEQQQVASRARRLLQRPGAAVGSARAQASPRRARIIGAVTEPAPRIVWTRVSGCAGEPLIEIAISPAPKR